MNPRQQILALVSTARPVPLAVTPPGWPAGLALRKPTLTTRDEIGEKLKSGPSGSTPPDALAFILARLVVDATGARVFGDDDAEALGALEYDPAFATLATQAIRLVAGLPLNDDPDPFGPEGPAGNP